MVTFVCHYCDVTLKKKQLERHFCGRPSKFICIDCSTTFIGDEYTKHISCMTEQEKYHGQYAKKPKQQQQQNKQTTTTPAAAAQKPVVEEQKENKVQETTPTTTKKEKKPVQESEDEEQPKTSWIGWRKIIKKIVKEQPKKQMKLKKLRQLSCQKYQESFPEEEMSEIEKIFDEKIKSNSKYTITNEPYISFAN